MRIAFMGTPAIAVPSFEALVARHDVVLAVTMPDRASGRGGRLRPSPVKQAAEREGVPTLQPSSLRGEAAEAISSLQPDVVCVVAFGMLLPAEILEIPPQGCINVHASLLPRHRGAAPIQRAILEGDTVTGVSIMRMEAGLDTGPYALQVPLEIGDRYADELEAELSRVGADALLRVLDDVAAGTAEWHAQDETGATYAPKVTKDDVALLPDLDVHEAFRRVRAATRRAPARVCVGDRELTVVRARPDGTTREPGTVCVTDGIPHVAFRDGTLALEVVRPAGKADMPGAEWARGARLGSETCWRCTR